MHDRRAAGQILQALQIVFLAGVAVVLGAYFDEDPQLSWAAVAVSRRGAAESTRLGEIQAGLVAYLDRAGGRRYVRALLRARRMSFAELTDGSPADALARIAQLHPGKAADLGHLDAGSFLALAAAGARLDGLESPRGRALYVVMMVLTSTRFARDPVYPWAREALDAAGADPDARAEALHARAMREIDRVVAQRGGPDA
ncbi:MAG TPA: hypothetical protein VEA38_01450 [Terriglobales bacterium]|nr:hypothetical protein [Terriglobales bacterium]